MTFQPKCVLVTGGAGFIGSNFVRWVLQQHRDVHVINFDLLTYAGNLESLSDMVEAHGSAGDGRYHFVQGDVRRLDDVTRALSGGGKHPTPDSVVHMAAESHVDRSIMGPGDFVDTNVLGTFTMLEACRAVSAKRNDFRFVQVSTDEVYGTLGPVDPPFTERTTLAPNSPYSASKAGADLLVRSYIETFDFPGLLTRCSNNYGPCQFPEKLIPLIITRALVNERLPVYGDGLNVRDWLYVEDHATALWTVLTRGTIGEIYNIGGKSELPNITIVKTLLGILGKPESLIEYVRDRPGHDRRYAMDISKITRELGWTPRQDVGRGLRTTVEWYLTNRAWWERVLSEAYKASNAIYLSAR